MPATPTMNMRLPSETLAQLDAIARREGLTKSDGQPNRTAAIRWLALRDSDCHPAVCRPVAADKNRTRTAKEAR